MWARDIFPEELNLRVKSKQQTVVTYAKLLYNNFLVVGVLDTYNYNIRKEDFEEIFFKNFLNLGFNFKL